MLGEDTGDRGHVQEEILQHGNMLDDNHRADLIAIVTRNEIKAAMFSIPGIKARGPDGFNSSFYNASWDRIGDEIIQGVEDFFRTD